jgi:hypothetical protein
MKIKNARLIAILVALVIVATFTFPTIMVNLIDLVAKKELVMCKGMNIELNNKNGKLQIEAINKTNRRYSWDSKSVSLRLFSRSAKPERWYGSMGIYCPSGVSGIHCVVEEGQQHFCSKQELMEWIYNYYFYNDTSLTFSYTNNGLGIGWGIRIKPDDPNMMALLVVVWQFYINGKKPDTLPGATDSLVKISFDKNIIPCMPTAGNFIPSQPTIINGRKYSGRAIDMMKEGNITSKEIEDLITKPHWKELKGLYSYYMGEEPFLGAIVDKDGRVVSVIIH